MRRDGESRLCKMCKNGTGLSQRHELQESFQKSVCYGLMSMAGNNAHSNFVASKIAELEKQVQLLTSAFNGSSNQSPQPSQASLDRQSQVRSNLAPPPPAAPPSTIFPGHVSQNGSMNTPVPRTPQYPTPHSNHGGGQAILSVFNAVGDTLLPAKSWARPAATLSRSIQSAYLTGREVDELFEMSVLHSPKYLQLTFLDSSSTTTQHFHS